MEDFETALMALLDEWAPRTPTDELISAMELRIMALKEEAGEE